MQFEGDMKRGIVHENRIPETLDELREVFNIQESESTIRTIDVIETNKKSDADAAKKNPWLASLFTKKKKITKKTR
jgi:hypothetical protein